MDSVRNVAGKRSIEQAFDAYEQQRRQQGDAFGLRPVSHLAFKLLLKRIVYLKHARMRPGAVALDHRFEKFRERA